MEIVPEVLKNYGQAIRHGHRHIYRSLPRMLTVWFDFGSTCAAQKSAQGKVCSPASWKPWCLSKPEIVLPAGQKGPRELSSDW